MQKELNKIQLTRTQKGERRTNKNKGKDQKKERKHMQFYYWAGFFPFLMSKDFF